MYQYSSLMHIDIPMFFILWWQFLLRCTFQNVWDRSFNSKLPRSALVIYSLYNHGLYPLQNKSISSFKLTTTVTNSLTLKQPPWNDRSHWPQSYQVNPIIVRSPLHTCVALIHCGPNSYHTRLLLSSLFFPSMFLVLLFPSSAFLFSARSLFFSSLRLLLFSCSFTTLKLPAVITSLDSTLCHCHQQVFRPNTGGFFSGLISSKKSSFSLKM